MWAMRKRERLRVVSLLPWWLKTIKNLHAVQEIWGQSLAWEDPLEKGMATYSSIRAWRIPMDRGA